MDENKLLTVLDLYFLGCFKGLLGLVYGIAIRQNEWFSVSHLLRKKWTMYQEQSERRN